jgi:hypothetical protein
MPSYLDLDLGSLDPADLQQDGRDYMQAQAPAGWSINPWMDWLLGAVARMAVLVLVLAGQVPKAIFKAFGTSILRVAQIQATIATGTVTVHASAGAGGTLPAGAQVVIDGVGFTTATSVTVSAAGTNTVAVQAGLAGAAANDLVGTAVELVSPTLVWVDALTLNAPTAGGTDGESDDEYVDRLANDETPLLTPKAVLIADAAALARADIEVFRALAIDNLIPPSTTGQEGHITVAVMAADGTNVSGPGKTRVQATLEAGRILGITAHIIDATSTRLDVAFTAQCYPDYDPTAVAADAKAAIEAFLSPLTWGIPPGGSASDWTDEPTVRRFDLIGVLYDVRGIRHVSAVTLARHGDALGNVDVTLDGPAAVPTIQTADIAATVAP